MDWSVNEETIGFHQDPKVLIEAEVIRLGEPSLDHLTLISNNTSFGDSRKVKGSKCGL